MNSENPVSAQARESIVARLRDAVGELDESWRAAIELDEEFLRTYLDLSDVPVTNGHLTAAERALIALGVAASVTTLDAQSIHTAVRQARAAGVSRAEALEAVELVSVLGVHTMVTGFPEVDAQLRAAGEEGLEPQGELSAQQEATKARFEHKRGYWSGMNETLLRVDHRWFAAYTEFSSHPWRNGSISPRLRELIYIAIDLSPTHLFTAGVGPHIANAYKYGATTAQIVAALEVTALVGMSATLTAAPIILEEYAEEQE